MTTEAELAKALEDLFACSRPQILDVARIEEGDELFTAYDRHGHPVAYFGPQAAEAFKKLYEKSCT